MADILQRAAAATRSMVRAVAAVVIVAVVAAMVTSAAGAAGAAAQIIRVGDSAGGVSADGTVVAGSFHDTASDQLRAYRWTAATGFQNLGAVSGTPGSFGSEVSGDGQTVVGQSGDLPFRWTAGSGITSLGTLPGGNNGIAWNASGDGAIVVGLSNRVGGTFRGFRWTAATNMSTLGDLPGGFDFSEARSISADGSVIVGSSDSGAGARAVRWLGTVATPLDMGVLRPDHVFSEALDVSANGQVVVGLSGHGGNGDDIPPENEAFRWTAAGGFQGLGDLPGGLLDSVAGGVNADGSVIVGTGNPGLDLPDEPFYWTQEHGMRRLWDVAVEAGADMSQWQSLIAATDVSADGLVIVGSGMNLAGEFAGYVLTVPEPAAGALGVIAALAAATAGPWRRRRRRR